MRISALLFKMSCSTKSTALNLLHLKHSTHLQKLRERCIPEPARDCAISACGLPLWSRLPLDSKIPILPNKPSPNLCTLTRRKLGEKLRIDGGIVRGRDEDLDVSDPYGYEVKLGYEGMHDKHLTRFFRNAANVREYLIKMGLVTSQLDVKCTPKEYNAYRNYLRVMQGKAIKKELQNRDSMDKEKLMLNVAELLISRKNEILEREEKHRKALKELRQEQREKIREIIEKLNQDTKKLDKVQKKKDEITQGRKVDWKFRKNRINQKLAIKAEIKHQKTLNTLGKWHERDNRLEKFLDMKPRRRENDKRLIALKRYEAKKKCQETAIEKDHSTRECAEQMKKSFIEEYEKKVNEDRRRLQDIFVEKRRALEKYLAKPRTIRKESKRKNICRCKTH